VCEDVRVRLQGLPESRLDGEYGLAAAAMRHHESFLAGSGSPEAGEMFREEIRSLVRRYGQESDITAYQVIGALRVIEHDIIDMMDQHGH